MSTQRVSRVRIIPATGVASAPDRGHPQAAQSAPQPAANRRGVRRTRPNRSGPAERRGKRPALLRATASMESSMAQPVRRRRRRKRCSRCVIWPVAPVHEVGAATPMSSRDRSTGAALGRPTQLPPRQLALIAGVLFVIAFEPRGLTRCLSPKSHPPDGPNGTGGEDDPDRCAAGRLGRPARCEPQVLNTIHHFHGTRAAAGAIASDSATVTADIAPYLGVRLLQGETAKRP